MIKRLFCTCIAATALVVTGKMISDYAEAWFEKCKRKT